MLLSLFTSGVVKLSAASYQPFSHLEWQISMSQVMATENKGVAKHHGLKKCRIPCFLEKLDIKKMFDINE